MMGAVVASLLDIFCKIVDLSHLKKLLPVRDLNLFLLGAFRMPCLPAKTNLKSF